MPSFYFTQERSDPAADKNYRSFCDFFYYRILHKEDARYGKARGKGEANRKPRRICS